MGDGLGVFGSLRSPALWKQAVRGLQSDGVGEVMMERETVTVPEVAVILGIGKDTAYRLVRDGTIPSLRFGKRLVIPLVALNNFLATWILRQSRDAGHISHLKP